MLAAQDTALLEKSPLEIEDHNNTTPRVEAQARPHRSHSTRISKETALTIGLGALSIGTFGFHHTVVARSEALLPDEQQAGALEDLADVKDVPAATDNDTRIALLARKFVRAQLSREELARLEIAEERVRLFMPRVASQDWERLAQVAAKVDEAKARNADIRRKLNAVRKK